MLLQRVRRMMGLESRPSKPRREMRERAAAMQDLMRLEGVVSVGVGTDEQGREAVTVEVEPRADAVGLPREVAEMPVVVERVDRPMADEPGGQRDTGEQRDPGDHRGSRDPSRQEQR